MSLIGDQIATEALEWVGTRVRWQGRIKGVQVDCKGLVAGVAKACGRPEGDSVEGLAGDYDKQVDQRRLRAGLLRLFDRASSIEPGDVLLLRYNNKPQHLAIAAFGGEMVHAMFAGPRQVVRVPQQLERLDSVWRWRELGGAG